MYYLRQQISKHAPRIMLVIYEKYLNYIIHIEGIRSIVCISFQNKYRTVYTSIIQIFDRILKCVRILSKSNAKTLFSLDYKRL